MHEWQFFNFISGTRIQDSTGNRIASSSSTNQQATDMAHVSFMQEQSKGSALPIINYVPTYTQSVLIRNAAKSH